MLKATNVNVWQDTHLVRKHVGEVATTIQESLRSRHHGGYPPFQLEEFDYQKV